MEQKVFALLCELYLDRHGGREELTPETLEERNLLKSQILSIKCELDFDTVLEKFSNAGLRALLNDMLSIRNGASDDDTTEDDMTEDDVAEETAAIELGPNITLGTHIKGVNDSMSGGLNLGPAFHGYDFPLDISDDATVAKDTLPALYQSMPHYMVSVSMLRTTNLLVNPTIYDLFPSGFFTTVKGMKRAWDEAVAAQPPEREDLDDYLFESLLKRGGIVENPYWGVKYPSDIVAHNSEDADPEFWAELRKMDWTEEEKLEREEVFE